MQNIYCTSRRYLIKNNNEIRRLVYIGEYFSSITLLFQFFVIIIFSYFQLCVVILLLFVVDVNQTYTL